MIRGRIVAFAAALVFGLLTAQAMPAECASPTERINSAAKIIREMRGENDASSMADVLRGARGVAIFPSVVKAGLIFGGKYGEGLLLRRDPKSGKWFGPSFIDIAGASWGLQIGIESTALVLVITNDRGMEGFTGDDITLGGDLSVAAGPVGRSATAATDGNLKASIYSYSMSKGLFAGLSLEGAGIDTKQDKNQEYWKKDLSVEQILKKPATDSRMKNLVAELNKLLKK